MGEEDMWRAIDALRTDATVTRERMARYEAEAAADRAAMARVEILLGALGGKVDALLMSQAARQGGMRLGNWIFTALVSATGLLSGWIGGLFHAGK